MCNRFDAGIGAIVAILTIDEAARLLRIDPTDELIIDLLPQVDAYILNATGKDWALDSPVRPEAKAAARIKLMIDYDNNLTLQNALTFHLSQLEAIVEVENASI